jgi:hypothetical protein
MHPALTNTASNVTRDRRPAQRSLRSARVKQLWDTNMNSRALFVPLMAAAICATNVGHADNGDFAYQQTNLVSDGAVAAKTADKNLQHPWRMAAFPGGPIWIAGNETGMSTLYAGRDGHIAL